MKKPILITCLVCTVIFAAAACIFLFLSHRQENGGRSADLPYEGETDMTASSVWIDARDQTEHSAATYKLGNTARRVERELPDNFIVSHRSVDDVFLYEVCREDVPDPPMLFFLHGQSSRKEENLDEMAAYADAGYFCVALDLQGHGERITDEPVMALEITKRTAEDIDLLLDYYDAVGTADTARFALIGFSQGGSVAYWYAAHGERTPCALAVGSTSPDYSYSYDDKCFCGGAVTDPIWSESEIDAFISEYNPILRADRMASIPILSGNGIDDDIVSYHGSEALERILKQGGSKDVRFYYFDGVGHDVPEEFAEKIMPFIQEYLPVREG